MAAISDPGRPSRRDRRRAQKLIDTAFAERRITAAERALRTQRIAAAQTRGDLAMITRDLVTPTSVSLGKALDPATLSAMRADVPRPAAGLSGTTTPAPAGAKVDVAAARRSVRRIVVIAVVAFVGICGLGLAALVPALIHVFHAATPAPAASPSAVVPSFGEESSDGTVTPSGGASNLQTAAGWNQLLAAIKSASGSTSVYDAVVYPEYAAVGLDGHGSVDRRFYSDGAWQDSVSIHTPAVGGLVDLQQIDPQVIARLPGETVRHFNVTDAAGTYLIINAIAGAPQILVYVQTSDGSAQYRTYSLHGDPIG